MDRLLKRLKLKDNLTTQIKMGKADFVKKLRLIVDDGSTNMFLDTFDIFSKSKNEYKGKVGFEGFKIKRRKRLFDMTINMAIAEGKMIQKDEILEIRTSINAFHSMMIPFYLFIIFFYLIFIGAFLFTDNLSDAGLIFIPFILLHAAFMLGLPYWMMRRSTRRMKHELEREFFYLTKESTSNPV